MVYEIEWPTSEPLPTERYTDRSGSMGKSPSFCVIAKLAIVLATYFCRQIWRHFDQMSPNW